MRIIKKSAIFKLLLTFYMVIIIFSEPVMCTPKSQKNVDFIKSCTSESNIYKGKISDFEGSISKDVKSEEPLFLRQSETEFNRIIIKFFLAFLLIIIISLALKFYMKKRGFISFDESSFKIIDRLVLNQDVEIFAVKYLNNKIFYIGHSKSGSLVSLGHEKKDFNKLIEKGIEDS